MSDFPSPDLGRFTSYMRHVLRPIARVLIARGIPAPAFYRMVKQAYVDVAGEELGSDATDSRISVATGVHRRDVKSLRQSGPVPADPAASKISTLATVVGKWLSDPAFADADGPRPLVRKSGATPGFEDLVHAVSRDVRPRTVLDELHRRGAVEVTDDSVILHAAGLVGTEDTAQKTHFFALNLGDHLNAAVENLLSETPPHLERAVFYNRLSGASVRRIEAEARAVGLKALHDINTLAAACQSEDAGKEHATHRVRFGLFFFEADEAAEDRGKPGHAKD